MKHSAILWATGLRLTFINFSVFQVLTLQTCTTLEINIKVSLKIVFKEETWPQAKSQMAEGLLQSSCNGVGGTLRKQACVQACVWEGSPDGDGGLSNHQANVKFDAWSNRSGASRTL